MVTAIGPGRVRISSTALDTEGFPWCVPLSENRRETSPLMPPGQCVDTIPVYPPGTPLATQAPVFAAQAARGSSLWYEAKEDRRDHGRALRRGSRRRPHV